MRCVRLPQLPGTAAVGPVVNPETWCGRRPEEEDAADPNYPCACGHRHPLNPSGNGAVVPCSCGCLRADYGVRGDSIPMHESATEIAANRDAVCPDCRAALVKAIGG